MYYQSILI